MKYTPDRRHCPSLKKAIIRYTEENYDRVVGPRERHRLGRREAGALQHPLHAPEPAGRGHHPRAVLGQLPRDGQDGLRRAGHRDARGRQLPSRGWRTSSGRSARRRKAHHRQQPEQPVAASSTREEFIAQIVEFCERKGIYLIMDDIYHKLVFDGQNGAAAATGSRRRTSRTSQRHRRQRHLEALRHDRLPHRLVRGAAEARRGHDQRPGADHVVRVAGPAGRRRRRAARACRASSRACG